MRLAIAIFLTAVLGALGYLIWHQTDNLALIEQTSEPTRITLFDTQSFVLPEATKITNKDKTTSEFYSAKDVVDAYQNAKKDYAFYIAYEWGIYSALSTSYGMVLLFGLSIGGLIGYWARDPIDKYDFNALREQTKQELAVAWDELRKAQETAQNAQKEALKQARNELEHEKRQAQHQRAEAEKERRAAIQAQQAAEMAIKKSQMDINEAFAIAEDATRKKNATYAASERFKRKLEKLQNSNKT
ncbi:MAG: hypothetical protein EOM80_16710 [Erysipelotrichia bacterium]|nr:hypothetical protein [Erysipelotrichia bacterium]